MPVINIFIDTENLDLQFAPCVAPVLTTNTINKVLLKQWYHVNIKAETLRYPECVNGNHKTHLNSLALTIMSHAVIKQILIWKSIRRAGGWPCKVGVRPTGTSWNARKWGIPIFLVHMVNQKKFYIMSYCRKTWRVGTHRAHIYLNLVSEGQKSHFRMARVRLAVTLHFYM